MDATVTTQIKDAPFEIIKSWSKRIQIKYALNDPPDEEHALREWLYAHAQKEYRYKFHNIPSELKNLRRWVCWKQEEREGKLTKVPYSILNHTRASSVDPETWGSYEDALIGYHQKEYDGIGFMFHEPDGYIGLDWDHVRDAATGEWDPTAFSEIIALTSYAEISPSHTGAHCIVKGRKPGDKCRKGNYEMYSKDRYFTFTGIHITETPTTVNVARPELIEAFYRKISDDAPAPTQQNLPSVQSTSSITLSDDDIIRIASHASNGEKFKDLLNGKWQSRYPSQSEAEEALCFLFAFYTKDITQIDRLMRRSKLSREKWDREDYRMKTIGNAIFKIKENYVPSPPSPGSKAIVPPQDEKHVTDFGNSERFINMYGFDVKYCKVFDQWYIWTEHEGRWSRDTTGYIQEFAKTTIRSIYAEAERTNDEAFRKALARWAMQCETTSHTDAILKLARSERCVVVEHDAFDRDPFLLNLRNGIYDLRNHQFIPHRKDLLISRLVPIIYSPGAQCPKWLAFLNRIFRSREDKTEIISFLQRFLGYCLTGSTDEQVLLLLYGAGENGKSVLLNVLNKLLGDYAANAAATTFTTVRSEAVRNDLARLDGVRVVTAIEANKNAVIDESLIKQITGGDIITARFLFKEEFEYRPQFKLLWAFNHKPHIRDATHSIWRRIILLPFEEKIEPGERILGLDDILVNEEGPGILVWMIQGLMQYQHQGLQPPSSVMLATKEYRNESDVLFEFIQDVCTTQQNVEVLGGDCRVSAKELYLAYKEWCAHNNELKVMSTTKFGRELSDRGFKKVRTSTGQWYVGIKIRSNQG